MKWTWGLPMEDATCAGRHKFHSILKLMKEVRSHQEEVPYNYGVFILYYATFFILLIISRYSTILNSSL